MRTAPFGDALAVAQQIGAVGGAQRVVRIVRGEQHAVAGRGERADFPHHLALVAEVEARGRLVEHHELRLLRERAGQQHELALAARDHGVGALREMRNAELLERARRHRRGRAPTDG